MKWIIFTTFVGTVSSVLPPSISKQYRSDYEYNKETDAFYKLHTEKVYRYAAYKKCLEEGAELATITSDEDLKQLNAIINRSPHSFDFVMIAPQVMHRQSVECDDLTLNHLRKIESEKCNAINHFGQIVTIDYFFSYQPFMCKVTAKDAPYSEDCGVYGNGYESRISTTGSCYKVFTSLATWDEAYKNCQAEGANLVILNNAEELEAVHNYLLKDKPFRINTRYFAGINAANIEPKVFRTVFNQTLEEVGFVPWAEDQLEGEYAGNCLALNPYRDFKYEKISCYDPMRYVCESFGTLPWSDLPSSANQSTFPFSTSAMMLVFAVISILFV